MTRRELVVLLGAAALGGVILGATAALVDRAESLRRIGEHVDGMGADPADFAAQRAAEATIAEAIHHTRDAATRRANSHHDSPGKDSTS